MAAMVHNISQANRLASFYATATKFGIIGETSFHGTLMAFPLSEPNIFLSSKTGSGRNFTKLNA